MRGWVVNQEGGSGGSALRVRMWRMERAGEERALMSRLERGMEETARRKGKIQRWRMAYRSASSSSRSKRELTHKEPHELMRFARRDLDPDLLPRLQAQLWPVQLHRFSQYRILQLLTPIRP